MKKTGKKSKRVGKQYYYWLMIAPCLIFLFVFSYYPMTGILMAFQDFKLGKGIWGSEWVGLYHFKVLFSSDIIWRILRNTVVIALGKCFITMFMGIAFAILLNEIRIRWLKKSVQTLVYLPHFLSWVILAGVVGNLFRVSGVVNSILTSLGFEAINFLGNSSNFQPLVIGTHVWKEFGYASIVYLAAITSVDPNLHEAAAIDGATWWRRVWHVTLPAMVPMILLMTAMNLSSILSAGFDQIYNLYSSAVYETGDILDTYIYRATLQGKRYSFGTAVGLVKSVVGMILMLGTNWFSVKFAKRSIF